MPNKTSFNAYATLACCAVLAGCAIPSFDIPTGQDGPTIKNIVDRITCEMVEMVRDGRDEQPVFKHRTALLAGNYEATMNLSLEVADTGELTPSFRFPDVTSTLAVNAGFKISNARTHNFTRKMRYSMRELHERWQRNPEFGQCPSSHHTNLAGELGIKEMVKLQFTAGRQDTQTTLAKGGAFGGTITFVVIRNINSTGPTWTLSSFVGPGNLGKLERKSTNKITFAFATGPVTKIAEARQPDFRAADSFLFELLISQDD